MRLFLTQLLAILLLAQAPAIWAKDRLIILAGQSNMMGRGKVNDLPATYKTTPANVTFFYQGREHPLAKFAWFGPEVSFAHDVARAFPNDHIILVKQAASGSLIQQWQPGQGLYKALLRQVGFATDAEENGKVDAILWMQGESDARSAPDVANQYGSRFATLVSSLRKDLQSPDSLFIYGQVSLEHPEHNDTIEAVRSQQKSAQSQLANALMIPTDNLGRLDDGIHFNAAGQMELGKRFAKAYIQHRQ
ncbi:MAG: sialate O-acetylesterase [Thiothrix sp.]